MNRINILTRTIGLMDYENDKSIYYSSPARLVYVALRDLMEKFGDLMVVGVSCDFAGAQAALADGTIDVFLMADRLEDCTGVSALGASVRTISIPRWCFIA